MFKAAEDATKKRREETLQKPARLPSFKNLQILKTHILNTLNNVGFIDTYRSVYIKVRNITITRLIFSTQLKPRELPLISNWKPHSIMSGLMKHH